MPHLASLCFPGKKTFNNLNEDFLDRRKRALNAYLQVSCRKSRFISSMARNCRRS